MSPHGAVCANCFVEMHRMATNEVIEFTARIGTYYKVHADRFECPSCGAQVWPASSMGSQIHHHSEGYDLIEVDHVVALEAGARTTREDS